jgi:ferrous iron transport protein A
LSAAPLPVPLDRLARHCHAVIARIDAPDGAVARRLHEMGFDEGVHVEMLHRGPVGGDPIAVQVGDMVVALRRAMAAHILTVLPA